MAGLWEELFSSAPQTQDERPLWNGLSKFPDVTMSKNIEDRRNDSFVQNWAGALKADLYERGLSWDELKSMANHPLTKWTDIQALESLPPITPLAAEAGANDIAPGHQQWVAQRARAEQAAVQSDPSIHSFNEPLDPNGPPVRLDRRKN